MSSINPIIEIAINIATTSNFRYSGALSLPIRWVEKDPKLVIKNWQEIIEKRFINAIKIVIFLDFF